MSASDTLTGTTDPLREAREHVTRTLNDAHALVERSASWLPGVIFRDPSSLGACRGKLDFAARMVGEVAADIAALTFTPSVDSGEEG